jgi:hypothetical protein
MGDIVAFQPADPVLYIGDQYVSKHPITGKVLEKLPNGDYRLRLWIKHLNESKEITASTEEFERLPEYIYRWRGESFINSKVYSQKRTASAQASINKNKYGYGTTWVQRAKVEWEDV